MPVIRDPVGIIVCNNPDGFPGGGAAGLGQSFIYNSGTSAWLPPPIQNVTGGGINEDKYRL